MRRISVVGSSGAGKSTVARALARNINVPFVELDAIFHQPSWAPLGEDEFRRRVAEVAAGDAWGSSTGTTAPYEPWSGRARTP